MPIAVLAETLDVIYINIWAILISLINLLIIFLILKKFLFRPVVRVVSEREAKIAEANKRAAEAEAQAEESRVAYEKKLAAADEDAAEILRVAKQNAAREEERILDEAGTRAAQIMKQADADIAQEKRKAMADIKTEISDLSLDIAEKVVGREIREEDHREMIDRFIDEIGEDNE